MRGDEEGKGIGQAPCDTTFFQSFLHRDLLFAAREQFQPHTDTHVWHSQWRRKSPEQEEELE